MKKILKYMLFCLPFLAAGCSEDDLRFSYDAPEDSMHLTPSTEAVVLNPGMKQDVAVTFTWNNATPREGAKTMTYYFKMDIAGNSFATSIDKIDVTGTNSISFTHKQLNEMLGTWGVAPGASVDVEAEIIADVQSDETFMKPEISIATFNVTSYSEKLFLAGSATSAGDDLSRAIEITEEVTGELYSYCGLLNPGEFYFPMSRENDTFAYGRGADDSHVAYFDNGNAQKFTVANRGFYYITLNLTNMTIDIRERVWMIGDATPNGWDMMLCTELERQGNSRTFKWKGVLTAGEIKFPLELNTSWGGPFLLAETNGDIAEGTKPFVFVASGYESEDKKWKVEETSIYEVIVNLDNSTVTFNKEELDIPYKSVWMVGDATPGGWNADPFRIKMTYDFTQPKGTFVWEGNLTGGEIKFPLHERNFEGNYLMAPYANAPISETTMVYSEDGNPDNKWRVKDSEAGYYRVTVNVCDLKVKFEKLD